MEQEIKKEAKGKKVGNEEVIKQKVETLLIIRIRGLMHLKKEIKDTLDMLRLYKKNWATVVPTTPSFLGMVNKVKDYITWGEVDSQTIKKLAEKRGSKDKKGNYKPFFRLSPPRKGFERKGIKVQFKNGGALGYRGSRIKDLLMRMI